MLTTARSRGKAPVNSGKSTNVKCGGTISYMEFKFEEKSHTYTLDGKPLTGITTVLSVIEKKALIQWAANMAVDYIKEMGPQFVTDWVNVHKADFANLLEEARTAHIRKRDSAAQKGTDTHALVEQYILSCIEAFDGVPVLKQEIDPTRPFEEWALKENIRFIAAEKRMYSKELWIAGTADFIFEKDGKTYIGDIKTYKKLWDRVPMFQCAGYGLMFQEMTGKHIDGYVVFNLPKERKFNEDADVVWSYDVEGDTKAFLAALTLYRTLQNWS